MDSFMNPQRKSQGLRAEEKTQPWSFVECERHFNCQLFCWKIIIKFTFSLFFYACLHLAALISRHAPEVKFYCYFFL